MPIRTLLNECFALVFLPEVFDKEKIYSSVRTDRAQTPAAALFDGDSQITAFTAHYFQYSLQYVVVL